MAAGPFVLHDNFIDYLGRGVVNLGSDTFRMALCDSSSNVADTSVDSFSSVTGELAAANGYAAGGELLSGVTWTESAGVGAFSCNSVVWTAAGGSVGARYAVIYDASVSSPVANPVVAHVLLDDAPADVVASDGNTLTVEIGGSGVFSLSRA